MSNYITEGSRSKGGVNPPPTQEQLDNRPNPPGGSGHPLNNMLSEIGFLEERIKTATEFIEEQAESRKKLKVYIDELEAKLKKIDGEYTEAVKLIVKRNDENKRLKDAILSYGSDDNFDWNVLRKLEQLEIENKQLMKIKEAYNETP